VVTGLQESFSWKGVAAAAVGAGVGGAVRAEIGGQLGEGFGAKLMTGVLAGMAAGVAVGALRGGRFSMQQVAGGAFGNAVGDSIVANSQPGVDWTKAPDESAAEEARLGRSGNAYANWPDQTVAESARLTRSGDAFAHWPDEANAETVRLDRYASSARAMANFNAATSRIWAAEDRAAAAAALQRQHASADAYREQLTREAFNFGDGRDARDIRLAFSHQSRIALALSDPAAISSFRYTASPGASMSATPMSARETATAWLSSLVGTSRAGNVTTGAFNLWLAPGELVANLPSVVASVPSAIGRFADGAISYAGRLWTDLPGTVADTMASGVDGLRENVNRVVNGNGTAMGGAVFAIGTAAVPLGKLGHAGNAVSEGLAYRLDLPRHLAGPDGFTSSGQLSGTHNLSNARAALDAKGASYTLTPTATDGILELSYAYMKSTSGKTISGRKTVYDPAVFSDQTMLDYALAAGQEGWTRYLANPAATSLDLTHGRVKFRVYVNNDKSGNPFVDNIHPIK